MIKIKLRGEFEKTHKFFDFLESGRFYDGIEAIAEKGVKALQDATPKKTGLTASSWDYKIEKGKNKFVLSFNNSNINDGVNIALLIQYGHGTPQGVYVEGIDYINPTLKPIFEEIKNWVRKEVAKNA